MDTVNNKISKRKNLKKLERRIASVKEQVNAVTCFNQGLSGEVKKLEKDGDKLEEFKDGLGIEKLNQRRKITSDLIDISKMSVENITRPMQVDMNEPISEPFLSDVADDDIHVPINRYKRPTGSISCKGCSKSFTKYRVAADRSYYIHCIKECSKYRKLGLIMKCDSCHKLLINRNALSSHLEFHKRSRRPQWMSPGVYINAFRFKDTMCDDKECPGCGKVFRNSCKKMSGSKGSRLSFEYWIHVIEDCEDYKKLNLIRECETCKFKFMNNFGYKSHQSLAHRREKI